MTRRALMGLRVGWVVATLALATLWRGEALVLLAGLALVGPVAREAAPGDGLDERQRLEDYRASHYALLAVYALLLLGLARAQFVDRAGLPSDWLLLLLVPVLVRAAVALGRGMGAARLARAVGLTAGALWLAFSLLSHGLSWDLVSESWIGGGIIGLTLAGGRWPRAAGSLLALLSAVLFRFFAWPALAGGRWEYGLAMTAALAVPPLLAGLALMASGHRATPPPDEFADLRAGDAPPPPHGPSTVARRAWPAAGRGLVAVALLFAVCAAVLLAVAAIPTNRAAAPTRPRVERLAGDREIDGVPCRERASYRADGTLEGCTISRDHTFANGRRLPAGTRVGLDEDGRPHTAFLPAVTLIDGHRCFGDGTHDPMTNFHANGRLRFCNLAEPETIQGIPCQRSSFWIWITQGGAGTSFHDNGGLRECLLAADVTVEGRPYRKRQHVVLDRDGHPAVPSSAR